jgi:hypothetical protein
LIAVDGGNANNASGKDCQPRRFEARMHAGKKAWQVSGAGECEYLARVAEDDAVE